MITRRLKTALDAAGTAVTFEDPRPSRTAGEWSAPGSSHGLFVGCSTGDAGFRSVVTLTARPAAPSVESH